MPRSMTAYASAEGSTALGHLRIEMRTVNHRFLEISARMPEELRALEPALRERIGQQLSRGKLDLNLRLRTDPERPASYTLNQTLLSQLSGLIDELTRRNGRLAAGHATELLGWPGLVISAEIDQEELTRQVLQLLDQAIKRLAAERLREGQKLAEILSDRVIALMRHRETAVELLPALRQALRDKLLGRIQELGVAVEPGRLEQELLFHLQRMDVDEELDRLKVHLEEMLRVLKLDEPVGRRLDFLTQELHRECNTFGSKSADARTSQLGIDMKVLVEQIREQVQNLE